MSVIVMGMEMPKCCLRCDLFAGNGCKATRTIFPDWMNVAARPKDCPLRPLPEKHGRLIDADELADGCDGPQWCRWLSEIEDMPTIVEAEGD